MVRLIAGFRSLLHALLGGGTFDAESTFASLAESASVRQELAVQLSSSPVAKSLKVFQRATDQLNVARKVDTSSIQKAFDEMSRMLSGSERKGAALPNESDLLGPTPQDTPAASDVASQKSEEDAEDESEMSQIARDFESFQVQTDGLEVIPYRPSEGLGDAIRSLTRLLVDTPFEGLPRETVEEYLKGLKTLMGDLTRKNQPQTGHLLRLAAAGLQLRRVAGQAQGDCPGAGLLGSQLPLLPGRTARGVPPRDPKND